METTALSPLPFVTADQLAELLETNRDTLLNRFISEWPEKKQIQPCPHLKLGTEYYFVIDAVKQWLTNPHASTGEV